MISQTGVYVDTSALLLAADELSKSSSMIKAISHMRVPVTIVAKTIRDGDIRKNEIGWIAIYHFIKSAPLRHCSTAPTMNPFLLSSFIATVVVAWYSIRNAHSAVVSIKNSVL